MKAGTRTQEERVYESWNQDARGESVWHRDCGLISVLVNMEPGHNERGCMETTVRDLASVLQVSFHSLDTTYCGLDGLNDYCVSKQTPVSITPLFILSCKCVPLSCPGYNKC